MGAAYVAKANGNGYGRGGAPGDSKARYESVDTHDPPAGAGGDIWMRPMDRNGRPVYDNAAIFRDSGKRASAAPVGAGAGAGAARGQSTRQQARNSQPPAPRSRSQPRTSVRQSVTGDGAYPPMPPLPVPPAMPAAEHNVQGSPRGPFRGMGVPGQQIDPQGYYYDEPSYGTPKSGSFPASQRHSYEVGTGYALSSSDSHGSDAFQQQPFAGQHPRYDSTNSSLNSKQQY